MSSREQSPMVALAYSWALREYRALELRGEPDPEQYGLLLRLVSKRLIGAFPRANPTARGLASRAGLDQALLDISTGFVRTGLAPARAVSDRVTTAWHGFSLALAQRLPTRLAQTAAARAALRRAAG